LGEQSGDKMTAKTLFCKKLILRQLVFADSSALHDVFTDPQTMKFWWCAPHSSFSDTECAVALNAELSTHNTCWAMTLDGKSAVGWINLRKKRDCVAEVGYILSRNHWGNGYGREALSAVLSHAFTEMGLRRIAADTDPENTASVKLLKSLGFKLEGHLRSEWETHIGVRDSYIFGLLCDEWNIDT
jgi:[ribosomal protein S5]-alanine N-acetyltransferase